MHLNEERQSQKIEETRIMSSMCMQWRHGHIFPISVWIMEKQ
jgi:hypothetical protein